MDDSTKDATCSKKKLTMKRPLDEFNESCTQYRAYFKRTYITPGTIQQWKDDPLWPTEESKQIRLDKMHDIPFCDEYRESLTQQEQAVQQSIVQKNIEKQTVTFDPATDAVPIVTDHEDMDEYWNWYVKQGQQRIPSMQPVVGELAKHMGRQFETYMISQATTRK
jgi:hypothetical protein